MECNHGIHHILNTDGFRDTHLTKNGAGYFPIARQRSCMRLGKVGARRGPSGFPYHNGLPASGFFGRGHEAHTILESFDIGANNPGLGVRSKIIQVIGYVQICLIAVGYDGVKPKASFRSHDQGVFRGPSALTCEGQSPFKDLGCMRRYHIDSC